MAYNDETKDLALINKQFAEFIGKAGESVRPTLEMAWALSKAPFVNQTLRNDPFATFFALQRGQEMKIPATMAVQHQFTTPDGKLGTETIIVRAVLLREGFDIEWLTESDNPNEQKVTITPPKRPDGRQPRGFTSRWTIERAEHIRIFKKGGGSRPITEKANWVSYRPNMLRHRALYEAAREVAADFLGGCYSMDELTSGPVIDIEAQGAETQESAATALEALGPVEEQGKRDIVRMELQQRLMAAAQAAGIKQSDVAEELKQMREKGDEALTAGHDAHKVDGVIAQYVDGLVKQYDEVANEKKAKRAAARKQKKQEKQAVEGAEPEPEPPSPPQGEGAKQEVEPQVTESKPASSEGAKRVAPKEEPPATALEFGWKDELKENPDEGPAAVAAEEAADDEVSWE